MSVNPQNSSPGFPGLGIAPVLLQALARMKITVPTPIQSQAIPQALEGKDIAGIAQTGTGKTLAFGIPMIQRLGIVKGAGLVVLPTRELALQVDEAIRKLGEGIGIRTAVLIGGASMGPQLQALRRNPHIVIGTPGRMNDLLNQRYLRLDDVRVVVLDEADRMLDMGFAPQIEKIFHTLPRERQTMLFSATMPDGIMRLASAYMKMPIRIEVAPTGTLAQGVTQEIFVIAREQRSRLLDKLLQQYQGATLIFTRTKHGAHKLANSIRGMGHTASEIHANRSQSQRREALEGFKKGKYRILTATDIASRGIDVTGIALVLNYDLPTNPEDYVHRIGRTARAGAGGHAISFVAPEQRGEVRGIERLIRRTLTVSKLPDLPPPRIVHNNASLHRPQHPAAQQFQQRQPAGPQNPENRRRSMYPRAQNRFRN
jgi:ATP-dependent RNA helicase RhlE